MGSMAARRFLWSLLLLLLLWACEVVPLAPSPTPLPLLVVVLRDELSRRPIRGGECRLAEATVAVDPAGRCRFATWPMTGTLTVAAPGYQEGRLALGDLDASGSDEVTVEVTLLPAQAEGVVRNAYTGRPVDGATVHVNRGRTVQSDAMGRFLLEEPGFPFTLTVQAPGYEPATTSFATTTVEVALRPNTLTGQVLDRYSGEPLSGAKVVLWADDPLSATTDAEGRYYLEGVPEAFRLQVAFPRYVTEEVALERVTGHDLSLRPNFLEGQVRDQNGRPLPQARVIWQGQVVHTDEQGRFSFENLPEAVVLQVLSPGFAKAVLTVTQSASVTVDLEPFAVQGIYVTSFVVSTYGTSGDLFTPLLDFVEQTELNAMVIEAKDAWGAVAYDSQVPLVQELGTASPRYEVAEILQECRRRGIYTIGYIVTFEDSRLVDARPEWGVQSISRGGPWTDRKGLKWADPYRQEVREYNIAIARELAELGFDEVQFDYIRFPTDGVLSDIRYAEETSIEKQYATTAAFVRRAYEELAPTGVFISADVFGYAAWRKMWEQGQDISLMTHHLDYICPMAYPSHYSPGEQGCANPNACPYPIVLETLKRAHAQMSEGQRARLRPWLQDFDLGVPPYGPTEVEAQIRAARDGGAVGWSLWNAGNVYTQGVDYSPEEEENP